MPSNSGGTSTPSGGTPTSGGTTGPTTDPGTDTGSPSQPPSQPSDSGSPTGTPTTQPPPVGTGNYQEVWGDEFNGSSVDRSQWNVRDGWQGGNEASIATNRKQNVNEHDGVLDITALREKGYKGSSRQYTSGYLDTMGLHSWKYGRFEMRAKLPNSEGMWPAFWLRDNSKAGEIDIMEAVGGKPTFTAQSIHQSTNGGQGKKAHDNYGSAVAQWHTYTLDVEPDKVTWYIDGAVVFTVTDKDASWVPGTFDDYMNIRLNLQVDGTMPAYYGHPVNSTTTYPAVYTIDYIRVYQKQLGTGPNQVARTGAPVPSAL